MELINKPYLMNEKNKHISKVVDFGKVNAVNMKLGLGGVAAEHDADVLIIVRTGKVVFPPYEFGRTA